ncbi:MAG: hypothetical protein JXR69_09250 [Candidatus Delongbacteria bacterium]|nr:hypothetical protein [Candidatus Delongbacteria bacterium]
MQKLITIYVNGFRLEEFSANEHLNKYLSDGWYIVSVTTAGSGEKVKWLITVVLGKD